MEVAKHRAVCDLVESPMSISDPEERRFRITEADLHPHLITRMTQRGVTLEEIEHTLNRGWAAQDAKTGTEGKVWVFSYERVWEGQFFEEKEVSVYYKMVDRNIVVLTVKARYGKDFPKELIHHES